LSSYIKLSSAEISNLWSTYINDSLTICLMTHFKETVENKDIIPLFEQTLKVATDHMNSIKAIFQEEKIAVPTGFPVEKHVVPNAPKLFSDLFYLEYMRHICKVGIGSHGTAIPLSPREDVRGLYHTFLNDAVELNHNIMKFMQEIGVFVRTPNMQYPEEVKYAHDQGFLRGYFGQRRPLLALEVTHLTTTSLHNILGQSTCLGFAQVVQEEELRQYFIRGKRLSENILGHVSDVLLDSDVPSPMTWDADLTNSTTAPFSDQLMLFTIGTLSNVAISLYGAAMSTSMRHDVGFLYANFIRKAAAFGEDGLNLQIERGWLEQPPQFTDHEKLAREK
jgi:hypothetical protein